MDTKLIGTIIARYRKKIGLTQAELASKLSVSDKTVSKWESGRGYPEITQLPALAALFGISIDYLMTGQRTGIAVAGNMIVDTVNSITKYPEIGMLTNITDTSRAVGGCALNTSIDLAKIDPSVPISAIGKIGNDENGSYIMSVLQKNRVDTNMVSVSDQVRTAFCNVMSLPSGERTFFSYGGANNEFSPADIDITDLKCKILHIGYILLLDMFDADDDEYGTVMARFLHDVSQMGIKTSIDVVSSATADYGKKIIPVLKYTDYAIINEIECCNIWGYNPRNEDGSLNIDTLRRAMQNMIDAGVREKVIIHCKEAGFCLDKSGKFSAVGSLKVDKSLFRGSVGAGDAFCAASLYGLYNGWDDEAILRFASAAAVCNLFEVNSIDGMRSKDEIMEVLNTYPENKDF